MENCGVSVCCNLQVHVNAVCASNSERAHTHTQPELSSPLCVVTHMCGGGAWREWPGCGHHTSGGLMDSHCADDLVHHLVDTAKNEHGMTGNHIHNTGIFLVWWHYRCAWLFLSGFEVYFHSFVYFLSFFPEPVTDIMTPDYHEKVTVKNTWKILNSYVRVGQDRDKCPKGFFFSGRTSQRF